MLETVTINPHGGGLAEADAAARTLAELLTRLRITILAIGNGTGGRETQEFVA